MVCVVSTQTHTLTRGKKGCCRLLLLAVASAEPSVGSGRCSGQKQDKLQSEVNLVAIISPCLPPRRPPRLCALTTPPNTQWQESALLMRTGSERIAATWGSDLFITLLRQTGGSLSRPGGSASVYRHLPADPRTADLWPPTSQSLSAQINNKYHVQKQGTQEERSAEDFIIYT